MTYYEDPVSKVKYTLDLETLYLAPSDLTNFVIKSQTKYIRGETSSSYAFIACNSTFKSFSFEENSQLQSIQNFAFYFCSKIQNIDISKCNHLTSIGEQAFYGCSSLSSILLPESLTSLGNDVFMNANLSRIELPASLTIIPKRCFYNNYFLNSIIIPSNSKITSLGYNMLANTLLRTFNIPASVKTIEEGCFEYAFLDSITISSGNKNYKIENNLVLTIDGTISLGYPLRMTGTAVFPNGVKNFCLHLLEAHRFLMSSFRIHSRILEDIHSISRKFRM